MYLYVNMYMYVCVCMYMCVYVYMHCILYMCICMYMCIIYMHVYMYVGAYVCGYVCMYICMICVCLLYLHVCVYMCVHMYICIYMHIYVYIQPNHYNADMVVAQASLDLWIALLRSNLQYLCDCHPWHCDVYLTVCFWDFPLSCHERRVSRSACISYRLCEHGWTTWLSWVSISSSSE